MVLRRAAWVAGRAAAVCALSLAAASPAVSRPAPAAAAARSVTESTARYDFDYAYPAAAAAIPGLRAALEADLRKELSDLRSMAAEGAAAAREGGFPFNPYTFSKGWAVVTQVPGWLSLSAEMADYSGGAHGNHGSASLLWDKRANRARQPLDLFVSAAALAAAIRTPFCDALDRQRSERRGTKVNRASGDMFDECIDPTRQTVILGSRSRRAFDRIGILVGPYAAGPYVEGDYEVTLPVTPQVLAAVRPEFRSSFATLP